MQVQLVERGQSDISDNYHLKISGLCSRFGLKEQVEDLLHKLGLRHEVSVADFLISADSDNLAAFIQFDFDFDLDFVLDQEKKDDRRQTLQTLTAALLDPLHRPHLRSLSRYGLLGFSPGTRDDAGSVWNMMGLKASFITGPVSFRDIQIDAVAQSATVPTPTWLQTVTIASLSAQVYFFRESASAAAATIASAGISAGAGQLVTVPAASWWEAGVLAGKFLLSDRLFPGSKTLARKDNAHTALKSLYSNVGNVIMQLRAIKNNINNLDAQYKLLEAVSALSLKEAEMLKTCNELSSHYELNADIKFADSMHSSVRAATHGVALSETCSGASGAGLGWMPLGLTLAYATHAMYTFWEAGDSRKKRNHCKHASTLLEMTHTATVESTIFFGWISTMGDDFTLSQVKKEGGPMEKKLAEKLTAFKYDICRDVETKQDISSRAVIQRYIDRQYKQISRLHEKLEVEVDGLYGDGSNNGRPA